MKSLEYSFFYLLNEYLINGSFSSHSRDNTSFFQLHPVRQWVSAVILSRGWLTLVIRWNSETALAEIVKTKIIEMSNGEDGIFYDT